MLSNGLILAVHGWVATAVNLFCSPRFGVSFAIDSGSRGEDELQLGVQRDFCHGYAQAGEG